MLKFKKGGYARHDSGTVYKVKDIFPNKYNPQVLLVSLVTRKRTYTRVIQTDSGQRRSCEMMKMLPVSFLLVLVSQIFLTTVIVRYDHMEKYEAQLLIFAAQCCFIWYQIAMFESASRKK